MSKIEDKVCDKIQKRAEIGINKYGVTLERDDLGLIDWMIHLQEELMDASVYAQKIISDVKYTRDHKKRECVIKQILEDMVYIAKQDGWDKSATGRQLIYRDAIKLLKELGCEDEAE